MSWLARSFANSLRLDDDDDAENDTAPTNPSRTKQHNHNNEETKSSSPPPPPPQQQQKQQQNDDVEEEEEEEEEELELQSRGVKEDLTELKQTLTRQLWGVASFLAPPPESSESEIRTDFAEIGGRLTEISKMASNYFPFGSEGNEEEEYEEEEEEEEGNSNSNSNSAVGITDEVLAFARNIAMHPETWLDFPLDPEEDLDDFEMSDVQQEHLLAIERLSPQLNALRIELCPCHMSESYFWKVYFVLLHSRLNKNDAEILSSPQVMEARAMWMQELQKKTKPETDWYGRSTSNLKDSTNVLHDDLMSSSNYAPSENMSPRTYASEPTTSTMTTDYETEKYLVESTTETQFVDKSIVNERPVSKTEDKDLLVGPSSKILIPNFEDDEDDWPDEDSELGGYSGRVICVGTDEDVSFSDLEDDDGGRVPMKSTIVSKGTT